MGVLVRRCKLAEAVEKSEHSPAELMNSIQIIAQRCDLMSQRVERVDRASIVQILEVLLF